LSASLAVALIAIEPHAGNVAPDDGDVSETDGGWLPGAGAGAGAGAGDPPVDPIETFVKYAVEYATAE
jgi:hypothetical protein